MNPNVLNKIVEAVASATKTQLRNAAWRSKIVEHSDTLQGGSRTLALDTLTALSLDIARNAAAALADACSTCGEPESECSCLNSTLTDLLTRVAGANTPPPRTEAIDAIRTLEATLVEALHGQTLRGLPNLGTGRSPLAGANVRSPTRRILFPRDGYDEGLPALVLHSTGQLMLAWTVRQAWQTSDEPPTFEFVHRAVEDAELRVEDLQALLTILPTVLTQHLAVAERAGAGWAEISALAHRVLDLVPRGL